MSLLCDNLKLTPSQVQFIVNALEYIAISTHYTSDAISKKRALSNAEIEITDGISSEVNDTSTRDNSASSDSGEKMKSFRLQMKRQLLKENSELNSCSKEVKQKELSDLYMILQRRFDKILNKFDKLKEACRKNYSAL
jgi:hypothetical protein